jgi:hypothetical protein
MSGGTRIDKPYVVFVEGKDEENVLDSILSAQGQTEVQCVVVGGKDKFALKVPAAVNITGFKNVRSLAIIRDADDDAEATFQSVRAVLTKAQLPCPDQPGQWLTTSTPRVGVYIVPGSGRPGFLEHLFLEAHQQHPFFLCCQDFSAACTNAGRATAFDPKELSYSLMVALGTPEPRLGRAFESGRVTADHQAFAPLKAFLLAGNP